MVTPQRTEPRFWSHAGQKPNWSHDGQKDRFVIFGRGTPKMGKKSWRETIGVKVRSEMLSRGQNFLFWPIWCDLPRWHWWHSAECRVPSLHFGCRVPLRHFGFASALYASGAQSFSPGFFTTFWRSTAGNYELVFLTVVRQKSTFGFFDHCATRKGLKNPRLMAGNFYFVFLVLFFSVC